MKTNDKILQKLAMIFMSVIISICSMPMSVVASTTELDIEESAVLAGESLVEDILVEDTTDEITSDADELLTSESSEVISNDELATGDSVTFKFYVGKDGGLSSTPDGYWYNGLDTYTANDPTKMSPTATVTLPGNMYWTPKDKQFIGWESPDGRWCSGDIPLSQLKSAQPGEDYVFTAVYKEYKIEYSIMNPADAEFIKETGPFFATPERPYDLRDGLDADEKDTYSLMSGGYIIPKAGKQFTGWRDVDGKRITDVSQIDFEAHYKSVTLFATFDSVATNTLTLTNLTGIDQASIDALRNCGFTVNGSTATLVFSKANEKFYLPTISKTGNDFYGWYETGKSPSTANLSVQFDPTIGRDISYTANFNEAISVALRDSLKLYQGQKVRLTATVNPEGTSQEVYWSCSDADVISLTDNVVKAKNEGTAFVTAISKIDSSKSATCKVTVLRSEVIETDNPGEYAINEETGEMNVWVAGLKKTGYYYTGTAIKPRIHVYDGGALLRENVDYTLSYKNNVKVSSSSKAQIIIKMKGQYSGTEVVYFDILPTPVGKLVAKDDNLIASYSNKKNQLRPTLTYQGSDLKYGNNDLIMKWFETDSSGNATNVESDCVAPGLYAVKVYAGNSGNFTADEAGYQVATIRVYGNVAMTDVKVNGFKTKLPYNNGIAVEQPEVSLSYKSKTLVPGEDYTVTYQDNRDLGTAKVTYEAIKDADGNYSGEFAGKVVKTYNLTGKYTNVDVTLAKDSYKFTNAAIKPRVTVKATFVDNDGDEGTRTLVQDRDYTVSYKNNKAVTASVDKIPQVIVKGKGDYSFKIIKLFTIAKTDFSSLILTISDKPYSNKAGGYKSPKILFTDKNYRDLKLKEGKDYTVTYATSDGSETPAPGQIVYVAINAKEGSSYTGNIAGEYRITGPMYTDIGKAKVVVNPNSNGKTTACAYTGSKIEPGQTDQPALILTVGSGKDLKTLKQGVDYEIMSYHNNIDPGKKATVVVRGIGDYRGVRAINFAISAKSVSSHWGGIFGW